jgi:hypothetical protein
VQGDAIMALPDYGIRPLDDEDCLVHVLRDDFALCDGGSLIERERLFPGDKFCQERRVLL